MRTSDTSAPSALDAATLAALSALALWAVRELSLATRCYALDGATGLRPAWRTPAQRALVASVVAARAARDAWVAAPASVEARDAVRVQLAALSVVAWRGVTELVGAEHPDDDDAVPPRVAAAALCAEAVARALSAARAPARTRHTLRAAASVEACGATVPVSPSTLATLRAARSAEALDAAAREVCA